ncbi:hypothetical protein [uncultured Clostridium sp.]|uniref:hypothetical protein n=1 Tax=uncultured Clostridium sp. TaxID=59620 RepID=UPI002621BEBE|nr:hypothetical protein [uncultured Clostridium sp.]
MKKIIIIVVLVIVIIGAGIGAFIYASNSTNTTSKTTSKENAITASNSKANTNENEIKSANTAENNSTTNVINTSATTGTSTAANTTSTTADNGTGNFASIVNGAKYFSGNIEGDTIIIPLNDGTVVNNQLILKEYYVDRLNEVFTLKIDSEGNNNYTFYEYYNGVNTGIFKLKATSSIGEISLHGTYSKPGSDNVIGISLQAYTNEESYPFMCGIVNNTPVTFIPGVNYGGYYEKYAGDNNLFNINYNYQEKSQKYNAYFNEEFEGKITGEYELNISKNGKQMSGVYIPASNKNVSYPVTLIGSFTPN